MAESELLAEDRVLSRVQEAKERGVMSYKFPTELEVNKGVNASCEAEVLAANHQLPGVAYLRNGFPTRQLVWSRPVPGDTLSG